MSIPLSALDVSVFTLGGTNLYAVLKNLKLRANNDVVDGSGLGDDTEYGIAVKQEQMFDFTVFQADSDGDPCSNLSIDLWTLGGTAFLGQLRGGSIESTLLSKERSPISSPFKLPNPNKRRLQLTTELLVVDHSVLTDKILTWDSTQSWLDCTAAITFGLTVFTADLILKAGTVTIDRDEMQMENVVATAKGRASGPDDDSLLGNILLGAAAVSLDINTGGGSFGGGGAGTTYTTDGGEGQVALITRLNTAFADSGLIEQQGTLAVQGGIVVTEN